MDQDSGRASGKEGEEMSECKRCKTPFTPTRTFQQFCSSYCRVAHHRTVTKPLIVNSAAHDPGLQLIAAGRMPTADSLTPNGAPAWTWGSIAQAFGADPEELAAILKPRHDDRAGSDVGLYEVMK